MNPQPFFVTVEGHFLLSRLVFCSWTTTKYCFIKVHVLLSVLTWCTGSILSFGFLFTDLKGIKNIGDYGFFFKCL